MIQKARFLEKQNPVTVTHIDGDTWFTICVNEQVEENTYESFNDEPLKTVTEYVYDLNQFKDNTVDEEEVIAHPEEYINYVPKAVTPVTPLNIEQRVANLETQQAITDQAVQDALLMLMGDE